MNNRVYVQYGSGPKAVDGCINYDASLTLRLQKFNAFRKILGSKAIFDEKIIFGRHCLRPSNF